MAKFIGVKMIEATPMRASMALSAGYKIGNAHPDDIGYEVTYPDGYKSWSPAGDILRKDDIKRFISNIESIKVGTKTTNITLTCLTGFEVHGQAACVKPENFNLNVGANYAQIKAKDKIWKGLGFVLQWVKYGLKR